MKAVRNSFVHYFWLQLGKEFLIWKIVMSKYQHMVHSYFSVRLLSWTSEKIMKSVRWVEGIFWNGIALRDQVLAQCLYYTNCKIYSLHLYLLPSTICWNFFVVGYLNVGLFNFSFEGEVRGVCNNSICPKFYLMYILLLLLAYIPSRVLIFVRVLIFSWQNFCQLLVESAVASSSWCN